MTATLEFRSLDILSSDGAHDGIRLNIVRGFLMPLDVRGTDYIVAAKAGRLAGNRVSDNLRIGLAGYVAASTPEEWRALTNSLLAVLQENGQPPGALIARGPYLGMDAGDVAQVNARVANVIEGAVRAGKMYQSWSIELEAIEPWSFTPAP